MYNPFTPPPEEIKYQYIAPPCVCLMAWVQEPSSPTPYYARIEDADADTLTAWVTVLGHFHARPVPFSALQSITLKKGSKTLQAFGRPTRATLPAWVEYAEASA